MIPPKIARDLECAILTPALLAVGTWTEARTTDVLVLEGGTGSGKSVAAAWAHSFFAHRSHKQPLWSDAPSLAAIAEWKDWAPFDSAPLVVIDDLGTEREPARMAVVLERLFNVAAGRAVITTNVSYAEAISRYGDRIGSRMAGSGHWHVLNCADFRVSRPEGRQAPLPSAHTRREVEAAKRAAEERARSDAAAEADRLEAIRMGIEARERLRQLTAAKSVSHVESTAADDERRRFLQAQIESLRAQEA